MQGELAALAAALLWALASVTYGWIGQQVSPLGLNISKGIVAIVMLSLTLILSGELTPQISHSNLWLLLLSGIAGIGLGDTAYFEAMQRLGARRTLLLKEALSPPITACFALIFLAEILSTGAWVGIFLTVLGVIWVISERLPSLKGPTELLSGISFGLLAALAQAVGAVLSRAALAGTDVSPLWAALLRLSAGVGVLLLWELVQQQSGQQLGWLKGMNSKRLLAALVLAAFGGTYLGIWLQQVALKYTPAGIAQTLGATSPLFVLPVVAALGEVISIRAVLGVAIAIGGIALIFITH